MKVFVAILFSLIAINRWDDAYNHGELTRSGLALASEMARAFGFS